MREQVKESIRVLSEGIAKTTRDKIISECVLALNTVGKPSVQDRTGDLLDDLTKYIQQNISAEFGRLLALLEASKQTAAKDVQQALQDGIKDIPLTEIGLSLSTLKSLTEIGCTTLGELLKANPIDVMDSKGLGSRSYLSIQIFLQQRGIDWPGKITDEQIKQRRYERLDKLSLQQLKQGIKVRGGYGALKDQYRCVSVLTLKELREYVLHRLTTTPDHEIYPFELDAFMNVKLFNKATLSELNYAGITTFEGLLNLTTTTFKDLTWSHKRVDEYILFENINKGLALIGRKIK